MLVNRTWRKKAKVSIPTLIATRVYGTHNLLLKTMAARMAKIFTPTYVSRVNAQLVYPAPSQVVKPHELLSALARPSNVAHYEPEKDSAFLAASLAYGLILGTRVDSNNQRHSCVNFLTTAFFVHNQYRRACGLEDLTDAESTKELITMADRHIAVACGSQAVEALLNLNK
ncbi:hypothetical protein B0H13DRAFT_1598177 [Mycena leptocephala]|nr:hypothetical protein B0H13DRAFT_1598177 [Mycena leptocephala]